MIGKQESNFFFGCHLTRHSDLPGRDQSILGAGKGVEVTRDAPLRGPPPRDRGAGTCSLYMCSLELAHLGALCTAGGVLDDAVCVCVCEIGRAHV